MSLIQAERVTRPQGSTRSVAVTGFVATVLLVATALLAYVLTAQLGTVPRHSAAAVARAPLDAEVPPTRLTIEVTESTLAADPERAMRVLQELREIGVRLSVDDFGTGHSSLSYLQRLQPDEVKVDRSFVTSLRSDENNSVIVRSTIELGHGLGLSVVAEGVEDAATFRTPAALSCDLIQGYLVARPMPADALAGWLAAASAHGRPGRSEAILRAPTVPAPRQVRA